LLRRRHDVVVIEFDPTQDDVEVFAEAVEYELLRPTESDEKSRNAS